MAKNEKTSTFFIDNLGFSNKAFSDTQDRVAPPFKSAFSIYFNLYTVHENAWISAVPWLGFVFIVHVHCKFQEKPICALRYTSLK